MTAKLGSGDFPHEVMMDWAKLPEGWSFHEVSDMAVDRKDVHDTMGGVLQ